MPAPTVFNPATAQWVHAAAPAEPTGGLNADVEGRAAVVDIIAALQHKGVLGGATGLNIGHVWEGNQVTLGPAVGDPTGGTVVDAEARTAIGAILGVLRAHGIIAGPGGGPEFVLDEDTAAWSTAAIPNPTGGTADPELRTAINAILAGMRSRGLIAQD